MVANAYYTIVYNKFIDDDEKFKKYCDYLSSESLESIDGFKDGSYNCDSLRSDLKNYRKDFNRCSSYFIFYRYCTLHYYQ